MAEIPRKKQQNANSFPFQQDPDQREIQKSMSLFTSDFGSRQTINMLQKWRKRMTEADAEIVLPRGREAFPQARPQIISDNGSAFIARDFKEFIRLWQTTPIFTSPHYPQSNGKLERFHRTLKEQAIGPKTPLSLEDARRVAGEFIEHYNAVRLHSAIGFVAPKDKLEGRDAGIFAERDRKLEEARARRAKKRAEIAL